MKPMMIAAIVAALATPAFAQGTPGTPEPATNQCWDTARAELRDKTTTTMARKTGETKIGQDQSRGGAPAPLSGNAAGSGQPKNPNAVRPPGVTDC